MTTALEQVESRPAGYVAVPLSGLAADAPLPFPLYLRTAERTWVLYRPATAALDASHLGRLHAEGVTELFIRPGDRELYYDRIGGSLERILRDRDVPLQARAEVLHGIATKMADDLLGSPPDRAGVEQAQKVMMAAGGLVLREEKGFAAIRQLMSGANDELSRHSLTVGFLSMGLARYVLGSDAHGLTLAGLAGLLHDAGSIGYEGVEDDDEHAERGAGILAGLGLPEPVVQAARSHHERCDGSGFPDGLSGEQIPPLARVVGVVDTFEEIYAAQRGKASVFAALRVLATEHRERFDPRLAAGLVQLFR